MSILFDLFFINVFFFFQKLSCWTTVIFAWIILMYRIQWQHRVGISWFSVGIYLFKFNTENTRTIHAISSKLTTERSEDVSDVALVSLLLTLKKCDTFFWCFHRWPSTSKYRLGYWILNLRHLFSMLNSND